MNKKNIFGEQEVNKKTTFNEEVVFQNDSTLNKTIEIHWSSPTFLRRSVVYHPFNPPLNSMTLQDGINKFFFKPKRPYVITHIFFTSEATKNSFEPFVYSLDIREYTDTNSSFTNNFIAIGVSVTPNQPVAQTITLTSPIILTKPYFNIRIIRRNPSTVSGSDHVTVVLKGHYEINI